MKGFGDLLRTRKMSAIVSIESRQEIFNDFSKVSYPNFVISSGIGCLNTILFKRNIDEY